jgi:hypothetical protein
MKAANGKLVALAAVCMGLILLLRCRHRPQELPAGGNVRNDAEVENKHMRGESVYPELIRIGAQVVAMMTY